MHDRLRRWGASLWQPSLARRLVVAGLLAFALVMVVLMGRSYAQYQRAVASHEALLTACRHLGEAMTHATTTDQARAVVQAAETYFNASREDFARTQGRLLGALLFELRAADGRRLYASAALQDTELDSLPGRAQLQPVGGRSHWTCRADVALGSVHIAEPALRDATVLSWIGKDLLPDLLLSFPIVLLPIWLAMHQGLRPLRRLARQLDGRAPQDFSPIRQPLRHAELRPLIAAFDALLARLREAVQRERAFVQDAAHELRTPMAVIAAQAHVLAQACTPEARRQAEAAMDGALSRASHLGDQLLAMAALDEQRPPQRQAVDLAEVVQQALAEVAATARERGLTLALDAPEHLPACLDLGAFHSVLHNLLDNALRYVPDGGMVEVMLKEAGGASQGWWLRVADDGPGIAEQDRERLFERFVRGPGADRTPGSGLGLAIVRQAVARLDGQVRVVDGLGGRGVAFEVSVGGLWLR